MNEARVFNLKNLLLTFIFLISSLSQGREMERLFQSNRFIIAGTSIIILSIIWKFFHKSKKIEQSTQKDIILFLNQETQRETNLKIDQETQTDSSFLLTTEQEIQTDSNVSSITDHDNTQDTNSKINQNTQTDANLIEENYMPESKLSQLKESFLSLNSDKKPLNKEEIKKRIIDLDQIISSCNNIALLTNMMIDKLKMSLTQIKSYS